MKLISNKLQLVRTPEQRHLQVKQRREEVVAPSAAEVRHYRAQLDALARLIPSDRIDWQLEGGVAVALQFGRFCRRHGDVDVALFAHELDKVESCLVQQNYQLFSRNSFHVLEYAPFDVLRATSSEEIRNTRRVKRMMAVKVDEFGHVDQRDSVLPRFDIHVHRRGEGVVYLDSDRIPFPADLFDKRRQYDTGDGRSITVASGPLMYFYKLQGRRSRHVFDLNLLEHRGVVSARDRARARAIYLGHVAPEQDASQLGPAFGRDQGVAVG